jgi:hypothetical protein
MKPFRRLLNLCREDGRDGVFDCKTSPRNQRRLPWPSLASCRRVVIQKREQIFRLGRDKRLASEVQWKLEPPHCG